MRARALVRRLAFRGVTPVALLSAVLVVEALIAVAGFTTKVIPLPVSLGEPSASEVLVAAAPTSAAPKSPSATPSATARPPTRTAAPPPRPQCDSKSYNISGRVTFNDGTPAYNINIEVYRGDGSYMATYPTDPSGGFIFAASSGESYKLFFIPTGSVPSGSARSQWWNGKPNKASANFVTVCDSDVFGINAVLVRT